MRKRLALIATLSFMASLTACSAADGNNVPPATSMESETSSPAGDNTNVETIKAAENESASETVGAGNEDVYTSDLTRATRVSDSEDYYIFDLRDDVTREKVYYRTRFGIEIAADLYKPKDFDGSKKYAGIVIGPPFGGVKEQGPGVYANELASRGFVVVAFDPAYHGYSGGFPRYTGSSSTYVEDFSAGVDYLGSLDYIDREKIGALGICGSGGFAMSAASMDTRIKAVVTSALYDISGNMNEITGQARQDMLSQMAESRWTKVDTGEDAWLKSYPDEPVDSVPEGMEGDNAEFFEFYGMKRGWHPNALGNVTAETMPDIMTLPTTGHVNELNTPLLMITGDIAHSRNFTEKLYEQVEGDNKELVIVENARHIDLYDDVEKIPFEKIAGFYEDAFRK